MPRIFSVLKFVRWTWTPLDFMLHRLSRIWRILKIEEGSYEVKWLPLGIPNINHVSVRRGFLTKANLQIARNPQARVRCIVIIGNLSTRRSWFTNGMAGRVELDRGHGLRAKYKSLSKTTWNHHERRQNNSVENAFQRFEWSFVFFLRRNMISDEKLLLLCDEYSSKNPEFEPLVSTWDLAFWSPWPQLKNVLTCAVAVMLQKYFRLASVVPRTSGA